jgi:DNA-binding ferritin-like protein
MEIQRKLKTNFFSVEQPTGTINVNPAHDIYMKDLITELLHSSTKIHLAHLKTTSYAAHKAMNEFYDEINDLTDSLAEQFQGRTEMLLDYPTMTVTPICSPEEAIDYMRTLYNSVENAQRNCSYSEIVNELDNIKSLINKTKYKLIFLK